MVSVLADIQFLDNFEMNDKCQTDEDTTQSPWEYHGHLKFDVFRQHNYLEALSTDVVSQWKKCSLLQKALEDNMSINVSN